MDAPAPRRTTLARASLVLGILGLIGIGPLAGLPAVVLGFVARRRASTDPATHGGKGVAIAGLTIGYVSLALGPTIAVLIACLVVPRLSSSGPAARSPECNVQLRQIGIALRVHADDLDGAYPTNLAVLATNLLAPEALHCPSDRSHASVTYELVAARRTKGAAAGNPEILRCPIHGIRLRADGTVD